MRTNKWRQKKKKEKIRIPATARVCTFLFLRNTCILSDSLRLMLPTSPKIRLWFW